MTRPRVYACPPLAVNKNPWRLYELAARETPDEPEPLDCSPVTETEKQEILLKMARMAERD